MTWNTVKRVGASLPAMLATRWISYTAVMQSQASQLVWLDL